MAEDKKVEHFSSDKYDDGWGRERTTYTDRDTGAQRIYTKKNGVITKTTESIEHKKGK